MSPAALLFGSALLVATALTPAIRWGAHRFGFLDHALTSRKIHGKPIPRLGGVGIVAAFFAAFAFVAALHGDDVLANSDRRLAGLVVGGAIVAALGVWDDLRGTGARSKLCVQFLAGGIVYALGFRLDALAVPILGTVHLGLLGFPLTLLWVAGVINALNLIDGLDGLAGGIALVAAAATFLVGAMHGDPLAMAASAALAGAVLGFLFFNFHPASIFMGDTGSMFLGFVLAVTTLRAHVGPSGAVALVPCVIVLGVPIADTLLSMGRRALRGVPMFCADRGHLHHRLLSRGYSQRQTAIVMYGVAITLAGMAIVVESASPGIATAALLLLLSIGYAVLRRLGFFHWHRLEELLERRRHNRAMRASIAHIGDRLRRAAEPAALWDEVLVAAPILGAQPAALTLTTQRAGEVAFRSEPAEEGTLRTVHSLHGERPGANVLELGWTDGRQAVDRDTEIAIEQLCKHLANALNRMENGRLLVLRPRTPHAANVVSLRPAAGAKD